MNEPKRWSELAGEALPEESELLRAGIAERMPSELRGQVWSAIALAAASGAAATALGAAKLQMLRMLRMLRRTAAPQSARALLARPLRAKAWSCL